MFMLGENGMQSATVELDFIMMSSPQEDLISSTNSHWLYSTLQARFNVCPRENEICSSFDDPVLIIHALEVLCSSANDSTAFVDIRPLCSKSLQSIEQVNDVFRIQWRWYFETWLYLCRFLRSQMCRSVFTCMFLTKDVMYSSTL